MKRKMGSMPKIMDMTPLYKKYPGYFLALSPDRKKVLGKGHTLEEARKAAAKKGFRNTLMARIPWENRNYLL